MFAATFYNIGRKFTRNAKVSKAKRENLCAHVILDTTADMLNHVDMVINANILVSKGHVAI